MNSQGSFKIAVERLLQKMILWWGNGGELDRQISAFLPKMLTV